MNHFVVWFQILNLFLVLLLTTFSSDDSDDPEEKKKNNVHIAVRQIYRAAVRSKAWALEHMCTFLGNKADHTGRQIVCLPVCSPFLFSL